MLTIHYNTFELFPTGLDSVPDHSRPINLTTPMLKCPAIVPYSVIVLCNTSFLRSKFSNGLLKI